MSANLPAVDFLPTEGILTLRLFDFHARDVSRVSSESFKVGPLNWKVELTVYRDSHTRNDGKTSYWYNYSVHISCLLPDDTQFYNCHANIRHGWSTDCRIGGVTPRVLPREPRFHETLKYHFTKEKPTYRFGFTFDRGFGYHDTDSKLVTFLQIILEHDTPPVRSLALDLSSNDTPWCNDLTIICGPEEKQLFTMKSILALISPVFRTLLYGDFCEHGADTIVLPETSYNELSELLLHIYPNVRKPISDTNVITLLRMADRYLIDSVTSECEKYLVFYDFTKSLCKPKPFTLTELMQFANEFRLDILKRECERELARSMQEGCSVK